MKNPILRILICAILFSLIAGIVVSIIGLMLGWKTSTQFSDGLFWTGAILISLGFLSVMGRSHEPMMPYGQSKFYLSKDERAKQWAADISQGYNFLAFLGTSGLLLLGLSGLALLVESLF
jgi:hypothetical protein